MAWDSKFVGGRIEINNNGGNRVTVYSKTDNDKKSFCNVGCKVIEAFWHGGEVHVRLDYGPVKRYINDCTCL